MKRYMLLLFLCFASAAYAGSQTGTVQYISVRASDGLVWFALSGGTKTGSPPCATANYWMIASENSDAGKKQYALLLEAQAAGMKVRVTGMDSCKRWGDGEDVNWIQVSE